MNSLQKTFEILNAKTEDSLRDWASSHHGACFAPGEVGYCEPEAASWKVEILTPADFSHAFKSQTEALDWINREIQMSNEDGLGRGWEALLVEDIQEEVYCLMVDEQAYIWDGWHRIAACVATNRPIVAVVGRPLPAPSLDIDSNKCAIHDDSSVAMSQALAAKSAIADMASKSTQKNHP